MKSSKLSLKHALVNLLAPVFSVLLCMGVFFSFTETFSAYADSASGETIDFDADGITADTVNGLIVELGGESYGDLNTKLTAPADASDFTTAKTVTLGGDEFIIAYVSKADYTANGTDEGDIIVTLWSEDSGIESGWSSVASDTPDDDYPANMYSASLIRSTLAGTPYLTEEGATQLGGAGGINDIWKPFNEGGAFYDYLATPANMAWQKTLSAADILNADFDYPNEAWGTPTCGSFADGYDYSEKKGYGEWKDDRIWLPALSETGNGDNGLWKTNETQLSSSDVMWLRSGGDSDAMESIMFVGTDYFGNDITFSGVVRPAIHLNLKAAVEAITPKPFEVTVNGATTKCATIEKAWEEANKASTAATVKMLADADMFFGLEVAEGKEITLDLNGHMLKYAGGANSSVITVNAGAAFNLCDCTETGCITGGTGCESGDFTRGGGVLVLGGTFTMTGGTVSGNSADYGGGVYVVDGTFKVSGAPNITGNKVGDSDSNVYMSEAKITVTDTLTEGAKIGVNNTGAVATGFTQNGDPSEYFIPDNPANDCIYLSEGTVTIGTHEWDEGAFTTPPTCTDEGEKSFTCINCNATKAESVAARGHTLTHHTETAATEDREGNSEYWSCEKCDNYFSDGAGENVIDDKSSVILPKLTPEEPPAPPEPPEPPAPASEPAERKKSYVWICWVLLPTVAVVVGTTFGVWLYKKRKAKTKKKTKSK